MDQHSEMPCDTSSPQEDKLLQKLSKARNRKDSLDIIIKALTVEGDPSDVECMRRQGNRSTQSSNTLEDELRQNKKLYEQQSLQTAVRIYNNRFRQNIACSPGIVQSADKTLYHNHLVGVSYYKNPSKKPSPYGESLSIWFNRTECELETNYSGVVGMYYQKMPKEVIIVSRFKQLALRIPYPFPKHIFKATGGRAIPVFTPTSQIEFMSVPLIRACSNISDDILLDRLKGKTFVGYTRKDNFNLTLKDGTIVNPFMYTVVEFHKEGYVSLSYPAADYVYIPDGTYTVRGSVIVVGGKNFGLVKNDGDAVNLQTPYADVVYKLSDTYSQTPTATKSTTKKTVPAKKTVSPTTNKTKIRQKSTNKQGKSINRNEKATNSIIR